MTVAWSKAGLLASGICDKVVKIWNPSTGECLNTLEGHRWPHCAKRCEFSMGWLYASPAHGGRGVDDRYICVP